MKRIKPAVISSFHLFIAIFFNFVFQLLLFSDHFSSDHVTIYDIKLCFSRKLIHQVTIYNN